jgi:cyclopropane fatty-acyl-phospholipid synthase-like methyltransferase
MVNAWKVMYRLGFRPWEQVSEPGAAQIARLLAREDLDARPFGRALDIGCGTGAHTIELAERGWDATGIDFVPQAVRQARRRAAQAGVEVRFVAGDATKMSSVVGGDYRLLIDLGCFHSLDPAGQAAYAREATEVAAPDAVYLLFAFTGETRRPLPRGVSQERVEGVFADWKLSDVEPAILPPRLKDVTAHWFRLQRR